MWILVTGFGGLTWHDLHFPQSPFPGVSAQRTHCYDLSAKVTNKSLRKMRNRNNNKRNKWTGDPTKRVKSRQNCSVVSVLRAWCSLHAAHWGEKHIKQQDWSIYWGRRGKQPCSRMYETEWWCPLLHYQHICFWIGSTNSDSSQTGVKGGPWKPSCCISADKPVSLAFFTY